MIKYLLVSFENVIDFTSVIIKTLKCCGTENFDSYVPTDDNSECMPFTTELTIWVAFIGVYQKM